MQSTLTVLLFTAASFFCVAHCRLARNTVELDYPESVRSKFGVDVGRIVSGWESYDGQHPFQVSLRMVSAAGGVSVCGASLIHHEWALTAAHCTSNRVTAVLRFGAANLTRPALMLESSVWHIHPSYDVSSSSVQPHDISVINIGRTVQYNDMIQPIRLQPSSDRNFNYNGLRVLASGNGETWTGSGTSEVLNWVYLSARSNFDCWAIFGFSDIIVDSTICASHYNVTSQSTCSGDSGGPLWLVDEDGRPTQLGVSSFVSGTGCHTEYPAGFVRPGHYHEWLQHVTGIDFDWEWQQCPVLTTSA